MSRTGIITSYLSLRLLVGSGFINIYLTFREESTKDNFRIADSKLRHPGQGDSSLVIRLPSWSD